MDWIALTSAVGVGTVVGTVVGKILDACLLSPVAQKATHVEWLRNQRLAAYSIATEDFLSFGLNRNMTENAFEGYAKISKALLLADDDTLAEEIDRYLYGAHTKIWGEKRDITQAKEFARRRNAC